MSTYNLVAISGSLRKDSLNTKLVQAVKELAPAGATVDIVSIADLPLFNQDEEQSFPATAKAFKDRIRAADGIVIATPEYNRSIPGVLKNAIDWASRPYGDNAWKGKPVYVMGATGGPIGTALAQYDVKKVMLYLDAHVLGQPETFVGSATQKFDEHGALVDDGTRTLLQQGLATLGALIERVRSNQE